MTSRPVGVGVGVGVAEGLGLAVAARLGVAVTVEGGVDVTDEGGVDVAVEGDVDVAVEGDVAVAVECVVGVAVVVPVGVGDVTENGAENSEVLLLMSVLVAVTCGPLSGPSNVQLPSLVKTEPSNTRPSSSESEKISTAQGAQEVPCSGPMPVDRGRREVVVGVAAMSAMPAAPLE